MHNVDVHRGDTGFDQQFLVIGDNIENRYTRLDNPADRFDLQIHNGPTHRRDDCRATEYIAAGQELLFECVQLRTHLVNLRCDLIGTRRGVVGDQLDSPPHRSVAVPRRSPPRTGLVGPLAQPPCAASARVRAWRDSLFAPIPCLPYELLLEEVDLAHGARHLRFKSFDLLSQLAGALTQDTVLQIHVMSAAL